MANWRTYTPMAAGDVVDADLMPFSDESQAAGSRTRVISIASLRQALDSGLLPIVSYAGNHTIDLADDLGAHMRITAAGAVTFDSGLAIGAHGVIENATESATVTVEGGSDVTILSAGTEITNGKWVAWVVVNTDVIAIVGAFADDPNAAVVLDEFGFVSDPVASFFARLATSDPTTGDDALDGFKVGSAWANTSTGATFFCFDPTPTAAVWIPFNLANTVDPAYDNTSSGLTATTMQAAIDELAAMLSI